MTVDTNNFEISPEKVEQELRPVVCEQQQTDRFKENYSIDASRKTQKESCIIKCTRLTI